MQTSQIWPDQAPDLWSTIAKDFDLADRRFSRRFADDVLDCAGLQPGEHLLDVAAGTGALAFAAAERGANVVATDFAPGMVEQMHARIHDESIANVETRVMDGQDLDLPDNSFDVATSQFGLIFFPDRSRGFRELYRVLNPGGRCVVSSWSSVDRNQLDGPLLEAVQLAGAGPLPWPGPPPALSLSDPEEFQREMEDAGFKQVVISKATHPFTCDSPDAVWAELKSTVPVILAMVDLVGDDVVESIGRAYIRLLRERYGSGPLSLDAEALIGVGLK
jgi:SAM-dependent methyltransferase